MVDMKNKKSSRQKDLLNLGFSVIFVCLSVFILNLNFFRLDFTSEKRYSLSEITKDVLSKVDKPLYFEIYLAGELPVGFKNLQKSLLELLDEYSIYSSQEIHFMLIDPSSETNEKKRIQLYQSLQKRGLQATSLQHKKIDGSTSQKIIFPSVILHNRKKQIAINLLKNNISVSSDENLNKSIETLEYELTRAITKIILDNQKTIAYLKGHGELGIYDLASINSSLSENYNIVQLTSDELVSQYQSIQTLIIAQPRQNFTERDKYNIDQYIMSGGSVMWLIDEVDCSLEKLTNSVSTTALYKPLNLDDQLFHYGVRINADLIMDKQCLLIPIQTSMPGESKKFSPSPWYFSPLLQAYSNHAISNNVGVVKGEFVNSIDFVGDNKDIKKTVLLRTSNYTSLKKIPMLVSLNIAREKIPDSEFMSGSRFVSVLLEGKFKSVFNNRMNKNINKKLFKTYSLNSKMIIISDGDIIRNKYTGAGSNVKIQELAYDRYSRQTYGNKEFLINCISYLSGDSQLMTLRSRKVKMRIINKSLVQKNRLLIQFLNIIAPIIIILLFAFCITSLRRFFYLKKS